MAGLQGLDFDRIAAAANADGEFQIAARLWNANLRLDVGERAHLVRVRDGKIAEFTAVAPVETAKLGFDVRIFAPESDWSEMMKPIPRPFYNDLTAAMTRHEVQIEGDRLSFSAYYRAISRLLQLMREARNS